TESQRTIVVRVARDVLGRITGIVDENLLRSDDDGAGMAERVDIERPVGCELEQVQRREVASRVVEEHVLGAGIRGIDARGVLGRVPAIDGGVVLHAGIAALPGGFGYLAQ